MLADLRYAWRRMLKSPGMTLGITATLGLGIGGAVTIFSMLNAAVLEPPPWPDPDRTVVIWEKNPKQGAARVFPSSANYLDWKRQNTVFDSLAHWRFVYFNVSGDNRYTPERVQGARVSAEFLPMLGGRPLLGRGILHEDEQPGRDRIAVLSYGYWQRRFAGRRDILGQSIGLDGREVPIVGVLGPEFHMFRILNRELDVYLPIVLETGKLSRSDHSLNVYGHLRAGVALGRAQAEMGAIARRLGEDFPETNAGSEIELLPTSRALGERARPALLTLLIAEGILLAIACVNTANLVRARANARRKEIAVRLAIGGARTSIVRQLLTESLLLAISGGVAGVAAAFAAVRVLDARVSFTELQRMHAFRIDGAVLGFSLLLCIVTALAFGLSPALRSSRMDLSEWLRPAGIPAVRRGRLALISEAALTTVLLIASAAAMKHALGLIHVQRGFDARRVLSMQLWLSEAKYADPHSMAAFVEQALSRVRSLPGVESASVVNYPPAGVLGTTTPVEGRTALPAQERPDAQYWIASTGYLSTIRLPLLRGRFFEDADRRESRDVAVISESLARRLYPAGDAVGQTVRPVFPQSNAFWIPRGGSSELKIVGIVKDVDERGLAQPTLLQLYLPYQQNPVRVTHLLVRAALEPRALTRAIETELSRIDSDQPVFDIQPLEQVTAEAFGSERSAGMLLSIFGSLAMILAAIGVYAVVAQNVSARTRELAIRVAVGARPRSVLRLVLRQALLPVAAGTLIGFGLAAVAQRIVPAFISNAPGWEPEPAIAVCVVMTLIAAAAAYVPALRAARTDPMTALRSE